MLKIVKRISLTSAIAAAVFMVIQVLADLYLPTLTSNIIDKGVAQGDVDYIWHTGFVMIGFSLISILAAIANTFLLLENHRNWVSNCARMSIKIREPDKRCV